MIRPIVKYGEEVLHKRATTIDSITDDVQILIDDMIETMYAASGVGLAAPQIGITRRVFVVDPSLGRRLDDLIVMINPSIIHREGVQTHPEGCLSIPGFEESVPRPSRIVVRGLNRDGQSLEAEGTELLARAFQHELDHLDGSLFLSRLRGIKRDIILRKIKKLQRTGKW